jgi:CheY-like chemotaxis protein
VTAEHEVLIVEDDADLREVLAVVLSDEGFPVIQAVHGRDALEKLRSHSAVCLIVLDLFMPVMNGWAFRDAQRRDPAIAGIPVVLVSADAAAARAAAGELDVVAAMAKPLDFDALLRVVGRHC